jgi:hypothetical protein
MVELSQGQIGCLRVRAAGKERHQAEPKSNDD